MEHPILYRFTDLAEMVCRVRQTTPDRQIVPYKSVGEEDEEEEEFDNSETEPDDSDFLTDPENCIEEVSLTELLNTYVDLKRDGFKNT